MARNDYLRAKIKWLKGIQDEIKEYPDRVEDVDDKIDDIMDILNKAKRATPP